MEPRKILNEVMQELGLNGKIRLRRVPMKHKIASFSFRTNTLRLNRNLLELLSEEELRYIIRHELVHLKVKDLNHGSLFLEEMKKFYSEKEIEKIERRIFEKLILLGKISFI